MSRALLLISVSVVALMATGCSDDPRPSGLTPVVDAGGDTGLPLFESGVDSSVPPKDDGVEDSEVDSGIPGDSATADTTVPSDTNVGDVVVIDAVMTRDTDIDAIGLEVGGPDTRSDTDLPDVFTVSDTRIDGDPDAPMPPGM